MKLIVDNSFDVEVGDAVSLRLIKERIQIRTGFPISKQILSLNGNIINSNVELHCADIKDGSVIHLQIEHNPAPPPAKEMLITIKLPPPFKTFDAKVDANDKVEKVKEMIQERVEGTPIERIVLKYHEMGMELPNHTTLLESQLLPHYEITVQINPSDSASTSQPPVDLPKVDVHIPPPPPPPGPSQGLDQSVVDWILNADQQTHSDPPTTGASTSQPPVDLPNVGIVHLPPPPPAAAGDGIISVGIMVCDNERYILQISRSDTPRDLLETLQTLKISRLEGKDLKDYLCTLRGEEMVHTRTLMSYGVRDQDDIYVSLLPWSWVKSVALKLKMPEPFCTSVRLDDVNLNDKVEQLKRRIEGMIKKPVEQIIIRNQIGVELPDDLELLELGITETSVLKVDLLPPANA